MNGMIRVGDSGIRERILTIRGVQVMLDRDLAKLYGVEVRAINQAVKRNPGRFPSRFMWKLTKEETNDLKSQTVISSWGGARKFPHAFIDRATLIHVGASLNCLGKRCFAFSTLEPRIIPDILAHI